MSSGAAASTARSRSRREESKGLPQLVTELWELVVEYAKQQTVVPIKALGRYAAYGIAGSVTLSIGLVLLVLGVLRVLQTETDGHFTGHLTFIPYLITLAVSGIVAGLAARAIGSAKRKARP